MLHSSRMRTGRTLTVFRCPVRGGGVYPQRKQKSKKNSPPKIGGPPLTTSLNPPEKLDPPENWRPPRKLGYKHTHPPTHPPTPGLTCKACWDTHPPCGQTDTCETRMHSSRMHTGRTLTVFRKLETPSPKIWSRHPPQKFGAGTPPNLEQAPPPVNRITHTCKNITLAKTSFRPVNITLAKTSFRPVKIYT